MSRFKALKSVVVVTSALAIPVLTNGCSAANNLQGALCCTSYKPGSDMLSASFVSDATINGQFQVFAQASGDIAAVTGQAIADVTASCRGIATDLGDDPGADSGKTGTDDMNFWCGEAVSKINATLSANASASLQVNFTPPVCQASVQASATCEAKCSASGSCDVKANPPTCSGGTLEVSCSGSCTASATAPSFDCTGSCSGNCSGSCEAQGGVSVDCTGKCDGTCTAGGASNGTGAQADGSCQGTCSGKCTMSATAPKISCKGTCSGQCDATCSAAPGQASVQCGGTCSATATPISCKGGTLKASCQVDASCDGNCQASLSAKAECSPPSVQVTFGASANAQLDILANTLEANLPSILDVFKAKGQAFLSLASSVVQGGATIAASGKIDLSGASCLTIVGANVTQSVSDFTAALSASGSVAGALKIQ